MTASFSFADTIKLLKETGVYEYVLPFLLVFAIMFALLEKTKVLGDDKTNINGLIAFVVGLVLIAQQGIVEIINRFLPRVSLILVVILMALVVIATIAGKKFEGFQGPWFGLLILIGLAAVIYSAVAGTAGGSLISSQDQGTLIAIGLPIAILALVFWIVTRSSKKDKEEGAGKKLLDSLAKSLK